MRGAPARRTLQVVAFGVLLGGCRGTPVGDAPIGGEALSSPAPAAASRVEPLTSPTTWRAQTRSGIFNLEVSPIPDPLPFNQQFQLMVVVTRADRSGELDSRARIQIDARMPEHQHGMQRTPRVSKLGDGVFLVEGMLFHMRGHWEIEIAVFSGHSSGQATIPVELDFVPAGVTGSSGPDR